MMVHATVNWCKGAILVRMAVVLASKFKFGSHPVSIK